MNPNLYDPFQHMVFTNDKCFLCGSHLVHDTTAEHVFPKWLQGKFNLWNLRLHLLNGTEIPYKSLKIPCCQTCNGTHLSALEKEVESYFSGGYDKFITIDRLRVYQWTAKIFYALLFKELSMDMDRAHPDKGTILTPKNFERVRNLHAFLQSLRVPFDFSGTQPWSIFIVRLHGYSGELGFDYLDDFINMSFCIRIGEIGIIALLEDNGCQEIGYGPYYRNLFDVKLHPIQFEELAAAAWYRARAMRVIPRYTISSTAVKGNPVHVVAHEINAPSYNSVFGEFNEDEFALSLWHFWRRRGFTIEEIHPQNGLIMRTVHDAEGKLIIMDDDYFNPNPIGIKEISLSIDI